MPSVLGAKMHSFLIDQIRIKKGYGTSDVNTADSGGGESDPGCN